MKTKKFVGYVPKGETIVETIEAMNVLSVNMKTFGMYGNKKDALDEYKQVAKRTITLSWEDEPVKEKK